MTTFKIEKVANMIFVTSECGVVFKAWNEEEFTEKKLSNTMNRISKNYSGNVEFAKMF